MPNYSTKFHQVTRVVKFSIEEIAAVAAVDPEEVRGALSNSSVRLYEDNVEVSWTVGLPDTDDEVPEGQGSLGFGGVIPQ